MIRADESPRVSVIVSVHQRPDYLRQSIQSVVIQEFTDWELLVVNEGAGEAVEIVRNFSDERMRCLQAPAGGGKGACMNLGLENARGDYVAYLSDGHIWHSNHLETLVAVLQRGAHVVGGASRGVVGRWSAWRAARQARRAAAIL